MTLQLPSEIIVDRFLPTGRRMLAVELADRGGVPAVCYHEGAFGIEPISYVVGASAVDAVETAVACLEAT